MTESSTGSTVVVIGSINLDETIKVAQLPTQGETVIASESQTSPGGKGANQAVAAARAGGARTCLIGSLGSDQAAPQLLLALNRDRIIAELERHDGPSGRAIVMLSDAGDNFIAVVPGANTRLHKIRSASALRELRGASVVLLQLETPASLIEQASREKRKDALLILNAAPAVEIEPDLWDAVGLLIVNQHEATTYTGLVDPAAAAKQLLERVPGVIVTLGDKGSYYTDRTGGKDHVAAVPIKPLDTTAAGDTYCGVLAAHLSRMKNIRAAMDAATRAAAVTAQRHGAQQSIPSVEELS